jgi:preprotein translocase subunit SecB
MSAHQQPNLIKMAGVVAAGVELQAVALRSLTARFDGDPLAPPHVPAGVQVQLSNTHEVAWRYRPEEKLLDVKLSFSTHGKEKATNLERMRVDCEFTLRYALSPSLDATEEHFKHFANLNAVVNAWPYYREAVQSCVARMGLPTLVLPLFRLPQLNPKVPNP